MSSSNCSFLTCMQISQEAVQVVWYSHLLKNFPQLVLIHTVKCFGKSIKEKWIFFWNFFAFLLIQQMLAIWSLVSLPFLNPACTSVSSWSMHCWSLAWRILHITLLVTALATVQLFEHSLALTFFGIGMKTDLYSLKINVCMISLCQNSISHNVISLLKRYLLSISLWSNLACTHLIQQFPRWS